jgi:heme/copper-type cytochrome/quinol oxidase subunit 2
VTFISWKPAVWFAASFVVGFLFYHIIINTDKTPPQAVQNRNTVMMFGLMDFFLLVSFLTWLCFKRHRQRMAKPS